MKVHVFVGCHSSLADSATPEAIDSEPIFLPFLASLAYSTEPKYSLILKLLRILLLDFQYLLAS